MSSRDKTFDLANLKPINLDTIDKLYRLHTNEPHVLASRAVQKIRQEVSANFRQLSARAPRTPHLTKQTAKQNSGFVQKASSFLNDPTYAGAVKYLQDEYFHFNNSQELHWNIPFSSYLPHQSPGASQPALASPFLFPSEIEFTEEGVRIKVFTSGFAKCQMNASDMTDIRVEGFENMIRLVAIMEEAQVCM